MVLESERMIIEEPTSFAGSAKRIWRLTGIGGGLAKLATVPTAIILVATAWVFVAMWYLVFGIFLVPFRVLNRGSKKRKLERVRHRELMESRVSQ